jgi:hypothetical protein
MAVKIQGMTRIDAVRTSAAEQDSWREVLPWVTFLLLFLCVTSIFGDRSEAGPVVDARGAAAVAPVDVAAKP